MAGRRANSRLLSALRVIAVLLLLLVLLVATVCVDAGPSSKQPKLGRPKGTPRKVDETVPDVDEILIVWGFHLDIGFTSDPNHFSHTENAVSVLNQYINNFLPQAIELNAAIGQATNNTDSYVYTTHAWVIRLLWECGQEGGGKEDEGIGIRYGGKIRCPDETTQRRIWDALLTQRLQYHAFPFNPELESGSLSMAEAGYDLVKWLDDLLLSAKPTGYPPIRRKTVVSQRDVPGITSGVVPLWNKLGIRGLTVGCNAASAPVGVPHNKPFLWRGKARAGEKEAEPVVVMYNDGGYGWEEQPVYHLHHLSPPNSGSKCRTGVLYQWWYDNSGPHPFNYVLETFQKVRDTYPNAKVRTATLEEVWDTFEKPECKGRMELIEGEMGDTWVYGWGSDPTRNWGFRELNRLRETCLADDACEKEWTGGFGNFTFWLMKSVEHTWGGSVVEFLGVEDYLATWRPHDFNHHRFVHNNFQELKSTWSEQRAMILDWSVTALEVSGHSLAPAARAILNTMWGRPKKPEPEPAPPLLQQDGSRPTHINDQRKKPKLKQVRPGEIVRGGSGDQFWEISFDFGRDDQGSSGVDHLVFGKKAVGSADTWEIKAMAVKGRKGGLGGVEYRLYDDAEFRDFTYQYCYLYISEFDLYKTGLPKTLKSTALLPRVDSVEWDGRKPSFTVHLSYLLPGQGRRKGDPTHASERDPLYGAPLNLTVHYEIEVKKQRLELTVDWDGKRATRIPEGISAVFKPSSSGHGLTVSETELEALHEERFYEATTEDWLVEKLGTLVSPADVFLNGSQFIHHTWVGAGQPGGVWVHSPDSGLLSVGTTRMLPYPLTPGTTRMDRGVAVNLYNSLWGTNFLQWWPIEKEETGEARFRFRVEFWDGKAIPELWDGKKDEE